MKEVVGVRFRPNGKVYYFDPLDFEVTQGTPVVVETSKGIEYGTVVLGRRTIEESKMVAGLRPIIRVATPEDTEKYNAVGEKTKHAFEVGLEKIKKRELKMKLISVDYSFDDSKIMFYFSADGRVDFRELVKDLASVFRTRIELRQIGVRDESKMAGGIGMCGRELCCHSYLADFIPVSIKMAKEQNLSLNPTKISGVCGRLMCCLKYEEETYEYLNKNLPKVGDFVEAADGAVGEVVSINVLRQKVKIIVKDEEDNIEMYEYKAEDVKVDPSKKRKYVKPDKKQDDIDLSQLRLLEDDVPEEKTSGKNSDSKKADNRHSDSKNGDSHGGDGKNQKNRDNRDNRDNRGKKNGGKNNSEKENRENKGNRDGRDGRDNKDGRENKDGRDNRHQDRNRGKEGKKPQQESVNGKVPGGNKDNGQNNQKNNQGAAENGGQGKNGKNRGGHYRHPKHQEEKHE